MHRGNRTPGIVFTAVLITLGELLLLAVAGPPREPGRDPAPAPAEVTQADVGQVEAAQAEEAEEAAAAAAGPVLSPTPGLEGRKVAIIEGRIPVVEFLQFLSDYSGLPLLYGQGGPEVCAREVSMAAPVEEADDEVVLAILDVNGVRVFRDTLPSGREVLRVESVLRRDPVGEIKLFALRVA